MVILFYPDKLNNYNRYSRVLRILENCDWVKYHNNPAKSYDLHIFWSYTRKKISPPPLTMKDKVVLNRGCWDVSKQKVNDIFNDIAVDPRKHKGICVEKREYQGGHRWHRRIMCPVESKPGYIYQKYIHDKEGDYYIRYRIFLMDGAITHVNKRYEKYRFKTSTMNVENIAPDEFFTPAENADICKKCRIFGIDFGELDLLIDNGQKIVIDVNNLVGGRHPGILARSQPYKEIDQSFLDMLKRYDNNSNASMEQ